MSDAQETQHDPSGPPPQERAGSERSASSRMGFAAMMLSLSTLLSGALGFLRDVLVTSWYDAGTQSDAYYAAFRLPDMMNYFLAGGTLSITFIPLFSGYLARGEEQQGWRLFSALATVIGVLLCVATAALMLAAPWIVPHLFPGYNAEQMSLTVTMTRIVLPAQLAFFWGGLLQATLFSRETFWPAAVSPLIYNALIILSGWVLADTFGVAGFSIGALLGAFCGPLLVPLLAARGEVRFKPNFDVRQEGFRRYVKLALPLMLGATLVTVDSWLHSYFGSSHAQGSVTLLNHSRKLMVFLFAIIGQAAGQAALPFLTNLYAEGREREMGEMLAQSLARVVFLALFAAAALAVTGEALVYALYHHGEFSAGDAEVTTKLLWLFAVGLTSWSAQTIAARAFYARQDTVTPMIVGTIVLAVSLPIYWALDEWLGVYGLALATSLSITLNVVAIVLVYRWRAGALPLKPLLDALARGALGAAPSALAAWGAGAALRSLFGIDDLGELAQAAALLGTQALVFVAVAALYMWLFKPPQSEVFLSKVRRKLKALRGA